MLTFRMKFILTLTIFTILQILQIIVLIERGWIWPKNANEIKDFYDITEKCKINQYICYKRKHLYDVIKRLI